MSPEVQAFFDEATNTVSYVVRDPGSKKAAIVDPVLDYDAAAGRTATDSADKLIGFVRENGFELEWILETHVHADHLSGAQHVRNTLGGRIAIGEHVGKVQKTFADVFDLPDLPVDGSQFDRLFTDGDIFTIGALEARVMHTPGHTPGCVTYVIGDAAFVGDTLFMPDYGTARTDFPGGSAAELYASIQSIFVLPDDTRLYMCHDYKAPGRDEYAWQTTVAEQRAGNVHVGGGVTRQKFVEMRESRDAKLAMPKLLLPSIQVNIRAGELPEAAANGVSYLKVPLNRL